MLWVFVICLFLIKVDYQGKGQKHLCGVYDNLEIKKVDNILAIEKGSVDVYCSHKTNSDMGTYMVLTIANSYHSNAL